MLLVKINQSPLRAIAILKTCAILNVLGLLKGGWLVVVLPTNQKAGLIIFILLK